MLYVFVDIKIDSLHFVETVKANLDITDKINLGMPSTVWIRLVWNTIFLDRTGSWDGQDQVLVRLKQVVNAISTSDTLSVKNCDDLYI
jgi:hypothetical protein